MWISFIPILQTNFSLQVWVNVCLCMYLYVFMNLIFHSRALKKKKTLNGDVEFPQENVCNCRDRLTIITPHASGENRWVIAENVSLMQFITCHGQIVWCKLYGCNRHSSSSTNSSPILMSPSMTALLSTLGYVIPLLLPSCKPSGLDIQLRDVFISICLCGGNREHGSFLCLHFQGN